MNNELKCARINQIDLVRIIDNPKTMSQNYMSWFYVLEYYADGKHTNAARQAQ